MENIQINNEDLQAMRSYVSFQEFTWLTGGAFDIDKKSATEMANKSVSALSKDKVIEFINQYYPGGVDGFITRGTEEFEAITPELRPITDVKAEIINDNNFLTGLSLPEYNLCLLLTWKGGEMVTYHLFKNDSVLFAGNDFKPSPLFNVDSMESIVSLLGFLTCQPGDTDPSYFDSYTPEQLEFANSYDAEVLKGLISDFESKDSEYHDHAVEFFNSKLINN